MTPMYDHQAALDMWASGLPAKAIAERLNVKVSTLTNTIMHYRNAGDPRATYRGGGMPRSFKHEAALDLYAKGVSLTQIARRLGANRNTVIGAVCRYRDKGDPRVVARSLASKPFMRAIATRAVDAWIANRVA